MACAHCGAGRRLLSHAVLNWVGAWKRLQDIPIDATALACIPAILLTRRKGANLALMLVMLGVNMASFLRLPALV